ncbi:hypothetical protein ACFWF7_17865 [Nocardia sp. NPDC060256]|uniref:hypothetical protein n=1 Tax=unclassified Nocardia TaxID=2637762 RepID=UPI0036468650
MLGAFQPGHRLQVTIGSGDAPTHIVNPKDYPALLGGVYDIQRTEGAASFRTLPLASASAMRR